MSAVTKKYIIEGMTCGHCKSSVEEEIGDEEEGEEEEDD